METENDKKSQVPLAPGKRKIETKGGWGTKTPGRRDYKSSLQKGQKSLSRFALSFSEDLPLLAFGACQTAGQGRAFLDSVLLMERLS